MPYFVDFSWRAEHPLSAHQVEEWESIIREALGGPLAVGGAPERRAGRRVGVRGNEDARGIAGHEGDEAGVVVLARIKPASGEGDLAVVPARPRPEREAIAVVGAALSSRP